MHTAPTSDSPSSDLENTPWPFATTSPQASPARPPKADDGLSLEPYAMFPADAPIAIEINLPLPLPILSPAPEPAPQSGLLGITLFDSPYPQQFRRYELLGNAAIMGPNGSGKTTALKLPGLFNGVSPISISTGDGKTRFLDHYFPRESSMIAFSFANHAGQHILLVYHRGPQGLLGRFFRCGWREDLFARPPESPTASPTLCLPSELKERAVALGIAYSNQLTYAETQQALLGSTARHPERKREFGTEMNAQDASRAPKGKRLADASALCKAVEERKASLPQLAELTAQFALADSRIASADHAELLYVLPIDSGLSALLPGMRGIEAAAAQAHEFDAAQAAHRDISESISWLSSARTAFQTKAAEHQDRSEAFAHELQATELAFAERSECLSATVFDERSKSHNDSQSALSLRKSAREKIADGKRLEEQRGPHWLEAQTTLHALRSTSERLADELAILEGNSSKDSAETRRKFLDEHEARANIEREAIRSEERKIEDSFSTDATAALSALADKLADLASTQAPALEALSEAVGLAREHQAAATLAASEPRAPGPESQALALANANLLDEQDKRAKLSSSYALAREAARSAELGLSRERAAAERARSLAEVRLAELDMARLWSAPHKDSPLAALREAPAEVRDAALSSLTERALLDARIKPRQTEAPADKLAFGLDIDFSTLLLARDGALEREATCENAEAKARTAYDDALQAASAAEHACKHAEQAHQLAKTASDSSGAASRSADETLELARLRKKDAESALAKQTRLCAQAAHELLLSAKQALSDARDELGSRQAKLNAQAERLRTEAKIANTLLESQKRSAMALLAHRRNTLEADLDARKNSMEKIILTQLAKLGIDPIKIKQASSELKKAKDAIAQVERHAHIADNYQRWLSRDKPSIDDDLLNASTLETESAEHARLCTQAEESLRSLRESHRRQTQETQSRASDEDTLARLCLAKHAELSAYLAAASSPTQAAELHALSTHTLAAYATEKLAAIATLRKERSRALGRCHDAFRLFPGSPPDAFWRERKNSEPPAASADLADDYWVDAYAIWHAGGAGATQRQSLTNKAKVFGASLCEFHRNLDKFRQSCHKLGRDVAFGLEALNTNSRHGGLRFGSIERLKIEVECELNSQPWHALLANASASHESWMANPGTAPTDSHLRALAQLIDSSADSKFLRADLRSIVGLRGSVVEVGNLRHFSTRQGINNLSSNALSYLIVIMVQLAYLNKARAEAPEARFAWPVDEMRDLDNSNASALFEMLADNNVDLLCAFTEPDEAILAHVSHVYLAKSDGGLERVAPTASLAAQERATRRKNLAAAQATSTLLQTP